MRAGIRAGVCGSAPPTRRPLPSVLVGSLSLLPTTKRGAELGRKDRSSPSKPVLLGVEVESDPREMEVYAIEARVTNRTETQSRTGPCVPRNGALPSLRTVTTARVSGGKPWPEARNTGGRRTQRKQPGRTRMVATPGREQVRELDKRVCVWKYNL